MKRIFYTIFIPAFLYGFISMHLSSCSTTSPGAVASSDSAMRQGIENDKWVFTAAYIIPQGGRSRPTNDFYTAELVGDSLIVALPYFGRAYGGGPLTVQSPLNFMSNDFTIEKEENGSGKWVVVIKPKDYSEVQSLRFTIFQKGSASLNIILTNRSAISFNGSVSAGAGKESK